MIWYGLCCCQSTRKRKKRDEALDSIRPTFDLPMWLCAFESGIVSIQYIRYLFYASKLGKSCGSWSRPFLGGLKKKGAPRDAAAFFFFLFLLIRFDRIIRCLGRPPCLFFVSDFAANPLHFFVFLIRRRQWRRWILTRWLAATFIHRSSDLELWILKPRLLLGGIGFGAKRVWWTSSSLFLFRLLDGRRRVARLLLSDNVIRHEKLFGTFPPFNPRAHTAK